MAIGIGFGFSKQKQDSYSGLRGTPEFGRFAGRFGDVANALTNKTAEYERSPYNMFQGQTGEQMSNTNPLTGLPMAFNQNLTNFGNTMFSNASAGGSFRGQNSPENTQGIVGSAMTNMGAGLLPYIVDWQKYITGLPEGIKQGRLGMYQNTLGSMAPGLGTEAHGKGVSFNANASIGGKGSPFG